MKSLLFICIAISIAFTSLGQADLEWGNCSFFDVGVGEKIDYNGHSIQLLGINNHYNTLKVGNDTVELKVARNGLPQIVNNIRIYIADNKNVKKLSPGVAVHNLLQKDALLVVSKVGDKLLSPDNYIFPVSFNDGFLWKMNEDTYYYSYRNKWFEHTDNLNSYPGIGINMHDARGIEKHWVIALEKSTVMWVEDKNIDEMNKEACVLLKSDSQPNIYYLYSHLYNKNVEVRKGQKLAKGEIIGTTWGDKYWGHLQISVLKSDSVPSYANRFDNCLNFFPQLFELYYQRSFGFSKNFTRGKLSFGGNTSLNGELNTSAYQQYNGTGWRLGKWNVADKVDRAQKGQESNARLSKVVFQGTGASSRNPTNYYDYEIAVKNGVYRIRARVGDVFKESWQKVSFEGVEAATYDLSAGELKWTTERVVKVNDRMLTIRIYVDETNKKVAGLSEVVFQMAY